MNKRGLNGDPMFEDFFDIVFIDEKWLYLSQKYEKYYLLHQNCKNKNYIPRLMFLCACVQSRFRDGDCFFYGRIGCLLLVTYEKAIRDNAIIDPVCGDSVMKHITSIIIDVIRKFMINKVLSTIRAKWPREDVSRPVFIQQDNTHFLLKLDYLIFCKDTKQYRFDIHLICQPPNSSDFTFWT
jgi:hypothetical protein